MKWFLGVTLAGLLLGCSGPDTSSGGGSDNDDDGASAGNGNGATTGAGGASNAGSSGSGNGGADVDCTIDSDNDGDTDCAESECVSDPQDANEKCYACGWQHNDPGTLVASGKNDGDTIGDMGLLDKCNELVSLWDFATEYHILFMTAAW